MNLKDRKALVLDSFLGVDLSSSPFDVNKHRAVESLNFINENGTNKKRNGWIERVNFNGAKINGIYSVTLESQDFFIIHAGDKIYNVTLGENSLSSTYTCISSGLTVTDEKSVGFVNKEQLYLLCGNYLVFGKLDGEFKLREVRNDKRTYVPTTTIGIEDPKYAMQEKTKYEGINVLTDYRINKAKGDTSAVTLQLDDVDLDQSKQVEINITTERNGELQEIDLTSGTVTNGVAPLSEENSGENKGSVNFVKGLVTINIDSHAPTSDMRDNIVIKFAKASDDYKRIAGCTFGIAFGDSSSGNRLFVSGNKDYKNLDWFSGWEKGGDYTYFVAKSATAYGSDSIKNVAYTRLGDGTIAMLKEQTSNEPTIYYRTFGVEEAPSEQAINIPVSPVKAGNVGIGAVSAHATANLNGDNLIFTNTGLYAVVPVQNVATNERVVRERSRYINGEFLRLDDGDFENAIMYALNGLLYLKVGEKCYVASSRYTSRLKDDYSDTFNYEFWVWDNIPACVFGEYNKNLVFGTKSGSVCFFDNRYTDRSFLTIDEGELAFRDSTTLVLNKTNSNFADVKNGSLITVANEGMIFCAKLIKADEITKIEANKVYVTETAFKRIHKGLEICYDSWFYKIVDIDKGELYFTIVDSATLEEPIIDKVEGVNILADLSNVALKIINFNGSDYSFNVAFKHLDEVIEFIPYPNLYGYINIIENVKCVWKSPIFDLGSNIITKKLQSLILTSEAKVGGKVSFGYRTSDNNFLIAGKGVQVFDINNLDFNNFSFETRGFPVSYSVRTTARDFNYIQFRFESANDGDCAINSIVAEYSALRKYKGVK